MYRIAFALACLVLAARTDRRAMHGPGPEGPAESDRSPARPSRSPTAPTPTPFSFMNDQQQPAGYTIDICKSVVASLERQLKVPGDQDRMGAGDGADAFRDGRQRQGRHGMRLQHRDAQPHEGGRFLELHLRREHRRDGEGIDRRSTGFGDLAGKKIAVIAGTTQRKPMAAQSQQLQLNATLVPVKDREEAIAALESGSVDGSRATSSCWWARAFKNPQALSRAARRSFDRALWDRAAARRLGAPPRGQHGAGRDLPQRRGREDFHHLVRRSSACAPGRCSTRSSCSARSRSSVTAD